MKQVIFRIKENRPVADGIYSLRLLGDCSAISAPGQFVSLKLEGGFLRRPFSVCDWQSAELRVIYKLTGEGTKALSKLSAGREIDALTGLGNGFNTEISGARPLLIGGGMGATPLYCLCKRLLGEGKEPRVLLGFSSVSEAILLKDFQAIGVSPELASVDGSLGHKGFVTELINDKAYSYFYACGPEPMFSSINAVAKGEGEFSFEARMGCGFGACMGCTCQTHKGSKRICKDGPVLERSEVIWE